MTDDRGEADTIEIRNTGGQWSGWSVLCGDLAGMDSILGDPMGKYQYRIRGTEDCSGSPPGHVKCDNECYLYILNYGLANLGVPNSSGEYPYCSTPPGQPADCPQMSSKVCFKKSTWDRPLKAYGYGIVLNRREWVCP